MTFFKTTLALVTAVIWFDSQTLHADETSDEAALRYLKTVLWPQAYRTQDTGLLARILDDKREAVLRLRAADRGLVNGNGLIDMGGAAPAPAPETRPEGEGEEGAAETIEELLGGE